ncbi:hypothetical protein GCM10007170_02150 [Arthrobacter liuii]|uniref:Uncharacterized protein n=1 Tax=Arthrobacter liuii TaxID=1476996 RepID=A0ABQ2AFH2_9MICC|nr:hypothetical protein GCM10007170_02150 [Arthrobacter liuii]
MVTGTSPAGRSDFGPAGSVLIENVALSPMPWTGSPRMAGAPSGEPEVLRTSIEKIMESGPGVPNCPNV